MKTLRMASFGMRGTVGDAITPEIVLDFACAFGTYMEAGKIMLARDTRASSPMLHAATLSGLLSTGCEVQDFEVCPTPILQFALKQDGAKGGVAISAGHNRMGGNALTLIGARGAYMDPVGGSTVLEIYHARDFLRRSWKDIGTLTVMDREQFLNEYLDALCAFLDAEAIRRAGFSVVIDAVNGSGCSYLQPFADRLGIRLIPINGEESGYLAHDPEPRPRNARQVAAMLQHVRGDIGFVCSSDMGRVSIVSETCETLSEESTFPLLAAHLLRKKKGTVVTNCCTTRVVDDLAAQARVRLVRSPVGQAYVYSMLADENGVIGGEGNGSVIVPAFSPASDGFLIMGLVLEAMAQTGQKISQIYQALPKYQIVKRSVYGEANSCYRAMEALQSREDWSKGGMLDFTDGTRVDWADGWIHVRASRTESMIRVISESRDRAKAEGRIATVVGILEDLM